MQFSSSEVVGIIFFYVRTGHRQQVGHSLQDFQTLPQKVGTENCCLT